MDSKDYLVGSVDTIFFENGSNFYKVIRILVDQKASSLDVGPEIVITGHFASIHVETDYQFFGQVVTHPKYGKQFSVSAYRQVTPTTESGLIEYLSSDRFKGIGKVLAERILDHYGENAIENILAQPESLKEIKGLRKDVAQNLLATLEVSQGTEKVFIQLSQWGFSPKLAEKIYLQLGTDCIEKIRENPYILLEKIEGIGFNKTDQLAAQLDFAGDAPERIMAGIYTAVYQQTHQEGDTYVTQDQALKQGRKLLETARPLLISDDQLLQASRQLVYEERLIQLADTLLLPPVHFAEGSIAYHIGRYLEEDQVDRFSQEAIEEALQILKEESGIQYDSQQEAALKLAISQPMSIITGGPGTGKTTLVKGLIRLHSLLHDYETSPGEAQLGDSPVRLAAPTGRAAKRMQEATGLYAQTIHRLIGYTRDQDKEDFVAEKLQGSLLIIDEMSMVDTWLMNWLLQSIPATMQVVLVGDKDQLASVGPGRVFADLIESQMLATISLKRIYRQASGSSIVYLAHAIQKGQLPEDLLEKQADRSFISCQAQDVVEVIQQIVSHSLKHGYSQKSLQVLAPLYKGPAGINQLNDMLQSLLNPAKKGKRELKHFNRVFRVGDKVLQLVNNTEDGVFNGDIGIVEGIFYKEETESKSPELVVAFDDRELTYRQSDLDQLTLAYCTSIHKAQGSEYPLVILPLVSYFSIMLRRDLVYTAVSRAKEKLILVGDPHSFQEAVQRQRRPRQTHLKDLLQRENYRRQGSRVDSEDLGKLEAVKRLDKGQDPSPSPNPKAYMLTLDNYLTIDPMIGMEGVRLEDYMEAKKDSSS